MTELPAGLAEPLHFVEPETSRWGPLLAAAVLVAILAGWLYWRWRRAGAAQPAAAAAQPEASGFEQSVEAIRARAKSSHRYRRGCHELADSLRAALEYDAGAQASATAREISRHRGESAAARLLVLLSNARFGRWPPGSGDLDSFCDLAIEVHAASGFRASGLRQGRVEGP